MSIDVVEIMKTGLFELHYARKGDSEEWSIVPTQIQNFFDDVGFDERSISDKLDEIVRGTGGSVDVDSVSGTFNVKPRNWTDDLSEDRVSPQFTDIDSLKKSLKGTWVDDIPWDKIPSKYKWVAMDGDANDWYAFEIKPEMEEECNQWDAAGEIRDLEEIDMPTPPHWTESLVRRPK